MICRKICKNLIFLLVISVFGETFTDLNALENEEKQVISLWQLGLAFNEYLGKRITELSSSPCLWVSGTLSRDELKSSKNLKGSFAEKIVLPECCKINFFGDLHGNVRALNSNLNVLRRRGVLGDNFNLLDSTTYLVFLGDYVDRGKFGIEVLYTILRLKNANWNNVIILQGNHEAPGTYHFGCGNADFLDELREKYSDYGVVIYNRAVIPFYKTLPAVVLGKVGEDLIQFCHGGIPCDGANQGLCLDKHDLANILSNSACKYEKLNYEQALSYLWSDFCGLHYGEGVFANGRRGCASLISALVAQRYMDKYCIRAIFRGHQHGLCGLKMFDRPEEKVDYWDPINWKVVVGENQLLSENVFKMFDVYPLFTVSSAAEAVGIDDDCFITVDIFPDHRNWTVQVNERPLSRIIA